MPIDLPPLLDSVKYDNNCWESLFNSAVIVIAPKVQPQSPCQGLELDFNMMIQLTAVEYPVGVGSGLVLMGYSTALIPIRETDNGMLLWHLETANHDYQLKISELETIKRQEWLQTVDFEYLRSKKALLGWCSKADVLLGTDRLAPTVTWSSAQKKPVSWHWSGANLQVLAQSASPLQIGGQAGMSFDRTVNTLRFNPSRNYLKCLQNSALEQVVLYDASAKRAWLVSLLSVLHHMLLVYTNSLEGSCRTQPAPMALSPFNGTSNSLEALKDAGGCVIQGKNEDSLTIRELIMGFSINLSRATLHKPKRSIIYGYELMDIVMDSPRSELKKQYLNKKGLAWSSLLSEVNCLFCSDLGEAIVGLCVRELSSLCNSVPKGYDFMAASMQSLERLSLKHGGRPGEEIHRLSQCHFWQMTGSPFLKCEHVGSGDSCWHHPVRLQEIKTPQDASMPQPCAPASGHCLADYVNGALVFGGPAKSRKRKIPLGISGMYRSQSSLHVPSQSQQNVEPNAVVLRSE